MCMYACQQKKVNFGTKFKMLSIHLENRKKENTNVNAKITRPNEIFLRDLCN